jgi:hypothetical protein
MPNNSIQSRSSTLSSLKNSSHSDIGMHGQPSHLHHCLSGELIRKKHASYNLRLEKPAHKKALESSTPGLSQQSG